MLRLSLLHKHLKQNDSSLNFRCKQRINSDSKLVYMKETQVLTGFGGGGLRGRRDLHREPLTCQRHRSSDFSGDRLNRWSSCGEKPVRTDWTRTADWSNWEQKEAAAVQIQRNRHKPVLQRRALQNYTQNLENFLFNTVFIFINANLFLILPNAVI